VVGCCRVARLEDLDLLWAAEGTRLACGMHRLLEGSGQEERRFCWIRRRGTAAKGVRSGRICGSAREEAQICRLARPGLAGDDRPELWCRPWGKLGAADADGGEDVGSDLGKMESRRGLEDGAAPLEGEEKEVRQQFCEGGD